MEHFVITLAGKPALRKYRDVGTRDRDMCAEVLLKNNAFNSSLTRQIFGCLKWQRQNPRTGASYRSMLAGPAVSPLRHHVSTNPSKKTSAKSPQSKGRANKTRLSGLTALQFPRPVPKMDSATEIRALDSSQDGLAAALCARALGPLFGYRQLVSHPHIPPDKRTELLDWYFASRISQCRDSGGMVAGCFAKEKLMAVGLCAPDGDHIGATKMLEEWEVKWGKEHLGMVLKVALENNGHVARLIGKADFHMYMLATEESLRGQGVGSEMVRKLLSWVKEEAQKRGKKEGSVKVDLDCPTERLVRMYERFGFVLRGEGTFLGDSDFKLFFMDKDIEV